MGDMDPPKKKVHAPHAAAAPPYDARLPPSRLPTAPTPCPPCPFPQAGLKLGSKVWVRDVDVNNPDVFVLATLKGIAGKFAQARPHAGQPVQPV